MSFIIGESNMKKIIIIITVLILNISIISATEVNELLKYSLNKIVEVHYSLGGSSAGYRLSGEVIKITDSGIILKTNKSTYIISFNYIVTIEIKEDEK